MIGALILGFVAGAVGRVLMPNDAFRHMSGPASWGLSFALGIAGAALGYVIFTLGLGIGDDDVFDLGGIVSAVIGVLILMAIVGAVMRKRGGAPDARANPPT